MELTNDDWARAAVHVLLLRIAARIADDLQVIRLQAEIDARTGMHTQTAGKTN